MIATGRTAQAHLRMRKTALKYDKFYFVITKPKLGKNVKEQEAVHKKGV